MINSGKFRANAVVLLLTLLAPLLTSFHIGQVKPGNEIVFNGNSFLVYVISLKNDSLSMYYLREDSSRIGNFVALKSHLEDQNKELLFATNAGMFNPAHEPVGLYIENGKQVTPVNTSNGQGNFFLKPNGIFSIDKRNKGRIETTEAYLKSPYRVKFATQSGPMLVIDGSIHPAFTKGSKNKYIRSGVGQAGADLMIFAISKHPVNFYDFAELFKMHFECRNALYLDGAISKFYIKGNSETTLNSRVDFGVIIGQYK